ncbi:PLP-dependent transferase [Ceratobasidium sp. AG-I]|nr:PLP-dependent transferase [Ceratobasidium sp. AG-I]
MANWRSSVDLSHHLSDRARSVRPNPLKALYKYMDVPGIISLAGGMPHPSLFPYETMGADVLQPTTYSVNSSAPADTRQLAWFWKLFTSSNPATAQLTIPKYANPQDGPNALDLSSALQYSYVGGLAPFLDFVRNFTLQVFKPAYSDFQTISSLGNTDGWAKASTILCQPGEFILTEDWTYPTALFAQWPMGVRPFPVPMDNVGMVPSELEYILANWKEEEHDGKSRPHVMYTIPIGQNPTGAVMGAGRKQAIYDICVKYDVIIVEDDPYYFLQFPQYKRQSERSLRSHIPDTISAESSARFLNTLAPSFIKFDYQGRVIRLDTFSKTIGPGCRLGWTTSNPLFASKMIDCTASTTGQASGISQALVIELVSKKWGFDGYVRWLRGIGAQYTARRDFMIDCLFESSLVGLAQNRGLSLGGTPVYDAYAKTTKSISHSFDEKFPSGDKPLFSFSIPDSGMFLWVKVHLKYHHDWVPNPPPGSPLEQRLWTNLAEAGVVVAPGYMFSTDENDMPVIESTEAEARAEYGHLRISFAFVEKELIKKGMKTFTEVILEFFH